MIAHSAESDAAEKDRAALLKRLMANPDAHDVRDHDCRCVTYFDIALWRSVTVETCSAHRDMCHNGHPFKPGVTTDHAPGESDPRWCHTCGQTRVFPPGKGDA